MAKKIIVGLAISVVVIFTLCFVLTNMAFADPYPPYVMNLAQADDVEMYYNDVELGQFPDDGDTYYIGMVASVKDNSITNFDVDLLGSSLASIRGNLDVPTLSVAQNELNDFDQYIQTNYKFPEAQDLTLEVIDYELLKSCYTGMEIPKGVTVDEAEFDRLMH